MPDSTTSQQQAPGSLPPTPQESVSKYQALRSQLRGDPAPAAPPAPTPARDDNSRQLELVPTTPPPRTPTPETPKTLVPVIPPPAPATGLDAIPLEALGSPDPTPQASPQVDPEVDRLRAQLAELQARAAAPPPVPPEYEQLRARNAELERVAQEYGKEKRLATRSRELAEAEARREQVARSHGTDSYEFIRTNDDYNAVRMRHVQEDLSQPQAPSAPPAPIPAAQPPPVDAAPHGVPQQHWDEVRRTAAQLKTQFNLTDRDMADLAEIDRRKAQDPKWSDPNRYLPRWMEGLRDLKLQRMGVSASPAERTGSSVGGAPVGAYRMNDQEEAFFAKYGHRTMSRERYIEKLKAQRDGAQ